LHVGTQAPFVHTVEPFVFVHALLQPPQCRSELCVSSSQPVATVPSQSP
jgi:hypothetical protein